MATTLLPVLGSTTNAVNAGSTSAPLGVIIPPPDIRGIIDKTAQFVAKHGTEFERRVLADKSNGQKFAFLQQGNPYRVYYDVKVKEFLTGEVDQVTRQTVPQAILDIRKQEGFKKQSRSKLLALSSAVLDSSGGSGIGLTKIDDQDGGLDPTDFSLEQRSSALVLANCGTGVLTTKTGEKIVTNLVPPKPPKEDVYTVPRPFATPLDIDVIKLTAQYVARNGQKFLLGLGQRERGNPQFSFLRANHPLFPYFTALAGAYTRCLIPSKEVIAGLKLNLGIPTGTDGDTADTAGHPGSLPRGHVNPGFDGSDPAIGADPSESCDGVGSSSGACADSGSRAASSDQSDKHSSQSARHVRIAALRPLCPTISDVEVAATTGLLRIVSRVHERFRWEQDEDRVRAERERELNEERNQQQAIDWHDFTVVETINFTEEDDRLPLRTPITLNSLVCKFVPSLASADSPPGGQVQDPRQQQEAFTRMTEEIMGAVGEEGVALACTQVEEPGGATASDVNQAVPGISATTRSTGNEGAVPGLVPPSLDHHARTGTLPAEGTAWATSLATVAAPAGGSALPPPPPIIPSAPALGSSDGVSSDAPPVTLIVTDYVRANRKRYRDSRAPGSAGTMQKCPITGQLIPLKNMTQHLRILLLDPRWKEQKDALLAKAKKDSAFASEPDFEANLANFVVRRPDLFGTVEDECESTYIPPPKRK